MLSNSCLVLPAVIKQQQEEISCNHVPSFFAISVLHSSTDPKNVSKGSIHFITFLGILSLIVMIEIATSCKIPQFGFWCQDIHILPTFQFYIIRHDLKWYQKA